MTRVLKNFYAVAVFLVFTSAALVIGAFFFVLARGLLLLCLAVLIGFALGRRTGPGVHTDIRPPQTEK
jgi:uncharacterized membrane protein YadS